MLAAMIRFFKAWSIAGVDEVGRGCCLPRLAAAVVLDGDAADGLQAAGLTDSKKLPAAPRRLVPRIEECELGSALGQASAREIDGVSIRGDELAMLRALQRLLARPELVLVDGNPPFACGRASAHCGARR